MKPCLPQHDPDPALREATLTRTRAAYVHDPAALPPFILPRGLPPTEARSATFGERLSSSLGVPANFAAVKLANLIDRFDELQDYEDLFKLFERPQIVQHWQRDAMFAEQRVAGVEPRLLRHAPRLPTNLRVPADEFINIAGISLDQAAAEGRLFLADYAPLDGIPTGTIAGRQKYLYAPIALFCWLDQPGTQDLSRATPRRGRLAPIAIQLDQRPTAENLYTPKDPAWRLAKLAVQAADYTLCTLGHHLAITHLAMAAFAMASARQLAATHPLAALLRPHLGHLLAGCEPTRLLLAPAGPIDRLFAPTRDGALEITARSFHAWDITDWALPRDLAKRGVLETEDLPHYPFRDDGLLLWRATAEFVADYLRIFYIDDADLAADPELHAWHAELADPTRGNIPGLPAWPLTRAALTELVTTVIFTSGPDHSALNERQWAHATYVPNLPMALYAPVPPRGAGPTDEQALLAMLPPQRQALAQLELVNRWTAHAHGQFGTYGDDDPLLTAGPHDIRDVVTAFQERLVSIEGQILTRNAARELSYLALLPSKSSNSAGT